MEEIGTDEKRPRLSSYGGHPPQPPIRMPHPEGPSHNFPLPSTGPSPGRFAWQPPPSPYEGGEQRTASDPLSQHHSNIQSGYATPARETSQYPPDLAYGRSGSVSAPTRSPIDSQQHSLFHPPNGTIHEGHHIPRHSSVDYRPRLAFAPHENPANGPPSHGLPMSGHQEVMQGPPAPFPPHAQYVAAPITSPPNPGQYDAGNYYAGHINTPYGQQRRRPVRAAQACDQCRLRKSKCDEARPTCGHCKDNNFPCAYREVPPAKQEKATQAVLDKLQQICYYQEQQARVLDIQSQQLEVLRTLLPSNDAATQKASELSADRQQAAQGFRPSTFTPQVAPQLEGTARALTFPPGPSGGEEEDDEDEDAIIGDVADGNEAKDEIGDLSITVEHTTAAHKLLSWPSIRKLWPGGSKEYDPDFVMRAEEKRGLIRLYGRGEGDDKLDGARSPPSPASSQVSGKSDEAPGGPPTPPQSIWGNGFVARTATDGRKSGLEINEGGSNPDGTLNVDADVVSRLYGKYMANMHILHPFLEQRTLRRMIERFISQYSPPKSATLTTPFASSGTSDMQKHAVSTMNKGPKRKRSLDETYGVPSEVNSQSTPSVHSNPPQSFERSVSTAIVLLILALGKICEYKGPLPEFAGQKTTAHIVEPSTPAMSSASMQSSSPFSNTSLPSPSGGSHLSLSDRSLTVEGVCSSDRDQKNYETMPGLAYYAFASDILGNLQGGNDLAHTQACLLAGLYAGQLAHPFTSHGWIYEACRACQVFIRPEKFDVSKKGPKQELIKFAFWTCLQLESDILAELNLPPSGISRFEEIIPLPEGVYTIDMTPDIDAPETRMMMYYSAQIGLRKLLNRVHFFLYKGGSRNKAQPSWSIFYQKELSDQLERWRNSLHFSLQWQESDPPATDIIAARLRAKYYGARYIIHRPFLHHALHSELGANVRTSESPTIGPNHSSQHGSPALGQHSHPISLSRRTSDMKPPARSYPKSKSHNRTFDQLDVEVQEACKICIEAAIRSTTALDGVPGRLIVTNIFGTAHAQFGNMLVLAAAYKSLLRVLIDREKLRQLLDRTIHFLLRSKTISPTLVKDAEILSKIRQHIFESDNIANSGSFSSEA